MASHQDIANRWADVLAGTESRYIGNARTSNVYVSGGRIYSYGSHFEMGRLVTPRRGDPFYLLNGDTYSVTTSRHQSDVRSAVARHADKLASLIVPYSALESAGIDPDSIAPVDIAPERTETATHRVDVPGLSELAARAASGAFGWSDSDARYGRTGGALSAERSVTGPDGARYSVRATKRGWDYSAPSVRDCGACDGTGHVDGAPCGNPSCNDGKVTTPYGGAWTDYNPPRVSYYRNGGELRHISGDTFEYDTYRHFLGAAVFAATVTDYSYRPCREHADNGRGFCDSCGYNVDNAPVSLRAGESVRHSSRVPMIERKRTRRAYFLSAFDSNESHPHYFLAELPARWDDPAKTVVRPQSVADAFRYLMPAKVRNAASYGADVKRQGDIFAIPADDIAARYPIAFKYPELRASIPLDGSGRHVARELVKLTSPDGRTARYFARGRIVHESGRRSWTGRIVGREHKALQLGDTWHELARNLVPMSGPNVATARSGRYPSGRASVRAWSIIGRID